MKAREAGRDFPARQVSDNLIFPYETLVHRLQHSEVIRPLCASCAELVVRDVR
jgi:hypothetical protein